MSLLSLEGQGPGGRGHNRCFWVWQGGPASTPPSGEDVGQWPVSQGPRTQPRRGEEACWPWGLSSDRSGEQGPRGGGLAENRACAVWLGMAGYFKQHTGEICVPWRWGGCRPQWLQSICAQRESCAESGLERPTGGTHHRGQRGEVKVATAARGQRGEVEVPTAARVGRFTGPCCGGPALRGNLPPRGMLGSLSQPLPSRTRKCAEGVMGVCNPFTSLVLDIYSL